MIINGMRMNDDKLNGEVEKATSPPVSQTSRNTFSTSKNGLFPTNAILEKETRLFVWSRMRDEAGRDESA
jgi:hypothetical protein